MRAPFFKDLCMILNKFLGGLFSSINSVTPPVKSSIASDALPPFNASYEPFNLIFKVDKYIILIKYKKK